MLVFFGPCIWNCFAEFIITRICNTDNVNLFEEGILKAFMYIFHVFIISLETTGKT